MGAFHATNFLLRFPWLGAGVIALSGVYSTKHFFGASLDGSIYFNSPLDYLANLQDGEVLRQIRNLRLTFCCGQGAWEDEMLEETRALEAVLQQKSIPAWVDIGARTSTTTGSGGVRKCRIFSKDGWRVDRGQRWAPLVRRQTIDIPQVPPVPSFLCLSQESSRLKSLS